MMFMEMLSKHLGFENFKTRDVMNHLIIISHSISVHWGFYQCSANRSTKEG